MDRENYLYQNILAHMGDGVITINPTGEITTFNQESGRLLGLDPQRVLGKKFAQVFLENQSHDQINQAILDAIYDSKTVHNVIIKFEQNDGKFKHLAITTTFLYGPESSAQKVEKHGVIVVIKDISQIVELQAKERKLLAELEMANKQLISSYRKLESGNNELNQKLHITNAKRHLIWIFGSTLGIIFLISLFFISYKLVKRSTDRSISANDLPSTLAAPSDRRERSISSLNKENFSFGNNVSVVNEESMSMSISLPGKLEAKVVNIISPFKGRIQQVLVGPGQMIKKGTVLAVLDTEELLKRYREVKSEYIKAAQKYNELKNWESSSDVLNARISLTKATMDYEFQKSQYEKKSYLFKKDLISKNDYEEAKRNILRSEMDVKLAKSNFNNSLLKGNKEEIDLSTISYNSAKKELSIVESKLKESEVKSNLSGVILETSNKRNMDGNNNNNRFISVGSTVNEGDLLFSIGDMQGMMVKTLVDEVHISKVAVNQKVIVTGEAFNGLELEGSISQVSSQAVEDGNETTPKFEVLITIPKIDEEIRKKIRLGMSCSLSIILYENPKALTIPITAIKNDDNGTWVKVFNPSSKSFVPKKIVAGHTNLSSVEVKSGLSKGDRILPSYDSPENLH